MFYRRNVLTAIASGLLVMLVGCGRKPQKYIILGVEMFSNLDRPIGDIMFNGQDLGVMNKWGGTGLITGVRIPFGVQTLTWMLGGPEGTLRNGEQVKIKNTLTVLPEQILPGTRYAGLHLYPDYTAEITFSEDMPVRTTRGKKLKAERRGHERAE
jgi:hypothetical protein